MMLKIQVLAWNSHKISFFHICKVYIQHSFCIAKRRCFNSQDTTACYEKIIQKFINTEILLRTVLLKEVKFQKMNEIQTSYLKLLKFAKPSLLQREVFQQRDSCHVGALLCMFATFNFIHFVIWGHLGHDCMAVVSLNPCSRRGVLDTTLCDKICQ